MRKLLSALTANTWYWLLAMANASVVLLFTAFPTVDGTPHALTSRLLLTRWSGAHFTDGIVCTGSYWVPNALGNYLLVAIQAFGANDGGERALFFLIILSLTTGSWYLARVMGHERPWFVLLVLPFTYSFLLVMGFSNFLLGMGGTLFLCAYAVRTALRSPTHKVFYLLGSLLVLWTHAMAFGVMTLVLGMLLGYNWLFASYCERTVGPFAGLKSTGVAAFTLLSLPGLILLFLFNKDQEGMLGAVDPSVNWGMLKDLRVLTLYDKNEEHVFRFFAKLTFVALGVYVAMDRIASGLSRAALQRYDGLLLAATLIFVVHLFAPDSTGYASYVSVRLQLCFFLLLIIWFACAIRPGSWTVPILTAVILAHADRLSYINEKMAPLSSELADLRDASRHLEKGAVVLPVSFERNWLMAHVETTLGVDGHAMLLENNAFNMPYFPLVWCKDLPWPLYEHIHLKHEERTLNWLSNYTEKGLMPRLDQIAVVGGAVDSSDIMARNLFPLLAKDYSLTYSNDHVRVYTHK